MATLHQTMSAVDARIDRDQYVHDELVLGEEHRDELIADVAHDKFRAKLAKNDPVNLLAAMESFSLREGSEVLEVFLESAEAFRTMILARMVELVAEDAHTEAVESVEHSERLFREARLEH